MQLIPWRKRVPAVLSREFEPWLAEMFKDSAAMLPEAFRVGAPPLNLAENEREFVVSLELPGVEEADLDVQIVGSQLVVSGERKWEREQQQNEFISVESQYGSFRRSVPLPDGLNLDVEAVQAQLHKGVLEIRLRKLEPKPAAKVKITAPK